MYHIGSKLIWITML